MNRRMPEIIMKLYEMCEYDRKLNCECCAIYYPHCRGQIKLIESRYDHFGHYRCQYFRDIIK